MKRRTNTQNKKSLIITFAYNYVVLVHNDMYYQVPCTTVYSTRLCTSKRVRKNFE
jgi:hypothetical protein